MMNLDASLVEAGHLAGDSLRELKTFPAAVQDEMGYAIYLAQCGQKHVAAKPLKALGSGGLEVVSDSRGGAATPKADIDLIKLRLKQAVS